MAGNSNAIRRLWYATGHRPAEGSFMFDERLDLEYKYRDAIAREVMNNRHPVIYLHGATTYRSLPKKAPIVTNWSNDGQLEVAKHIHYCPECGNRLKFVQENWQECDWGHGRVYVTDNPDGLPIAVFEPYGMD